MKWQPDKFCSIDGCDKKHYGKGLCQRHYKRQHFYGRTTLLEIPSNQPYIKKRSKNSGSEETYEHRIIAEKALGKSLPSGTEVHHVDTNGKNNGPGNLVICPNHEYHMLLHRRQRAYDSCGQANYLKCEICKKWDSPENLYIRKTKSGQWHKLCGNLKRNERKRNSKEIMNHV